MSRMTIMQLTDIQNLRRFHLLPKFIQLLK